MRAILLMENPNISPMDNVIFGGFTVGQRQPWSRDSVRVVSWNIDRGLRFSAILDFLRAAEADLILLQEVDLNVRRTHHCDIASELARSLRLNYVFGKEFEELSAGSQASPAYHGQATLSPWPLSNERIIRFRRQSNFWNPRRFLPNIETLQRRLGGRITLVAEAHIYGRKLMTYNLHLESKGNDVLRVCQLKEVLDDAARHSRSSPVLIAGDFNLNAGEGDVAVALHVAGFVGTARLPDVPTAVARGVFAQAQCIDWVFLSREVVLSESQVHETVSASDHYPISASFVLHSGNFPKVVP